MAHSKPQTTEQYFRTHLIMFYAFLVSQIMFGIVAYLVVNINDEVIVDQELSDVFIYIVPLIIVADFVAGNFLYKQLLKSAKAKSSMVEKMNTYTTITILRLAFAEGATLFTTIVYILTSNIIFAGCAGILIVVFNAFKPSKEKAIMDLELKHGVFDDPHDVIAETTLS